MSTENLLESLLEGSTTATSHTPPKMPEGDEGINTELVETEDTGTDEPDALEEANLITFAQGQMVLHEQMNIVRLNKQTQLLNLTNRSALILAKRANDTLFAQYAKFNALRLKARGAILKKYGSRASAYARKLMTKVAQPVSKK
jgi:hypothetical protein